MQFGCARNERVPVAGERAALHEPRDVRASLQARIDARVLRPLAHGGRFDLRRRQKRPCICIPHVDRSLEPGTLDPGGRHAGQGLRRRYTPEDRRPELARRTFVDAASARRARAGTYEH